MFGRQSDLLAILDAGPVLCDDLASLSKARRRSALLGIDALIEALDAIEPDPDLEPTLAGGIGAGHADECELDNDDEWSGDEHEPSLGAPDHMMSVRGPMFGRAVDPACSQLHWSRGGVQDLEEENEHGGDILDELHYAEADYAGA